MMDKQQKTLGIIKPDAVKRNKVGEIISKIEKNNFKIVAIKTVHLNYEQAKSFYEEHTGKHFFKNLIEYMVSDQIYVFVLTGPEVVNQFRALIGKTNPSEAALGTIRAEFGINNTENSIHGSDSEHSAEQEIAFFFSKPEIIS